MVTASLPVWQRWRPRPPLRDRHCCAGFGVVGLNFASLGAPLLLLLSGLLGPIDAEAEAAGAGAHTSAWASASAASDAARASAIASARRSRTGAAEKAVAAASHSWWWPFDSQPTDLDLEGDLHAASGAVSGLEGDQDLDEALRAPRRPGVGKTTLRTPQRHHGPQLSALAAAREVITPDALPLSGRLDHSRTGSSAAAAAKEQGDGENDVLDEVPGPEPFLVLAASRPRPRTALQSLSVASSRYAAERHASGAEGQEEKCLEFATWAKAQHLQGPELIGVWMSTCHPAVKAGAATTKYEQMCNAIGGAVSEFADVPDWTPEQACTALLRTFRESGVGSTPLSG